MNPKVDLREYSKFGNGTHEHSLTGRENRLGTPFIPTYV